MINNSFIKKIDARELERDESDREKRANINGWIVEVFLIKIYVL
jgi:hypothetical protein